MVSLPPPSRRPAAEADLGRACPYCQSRFEAGTTLVACGACAAEHHDDCWEDNGGCAVMGCGGSVDLTLLDASTPPHAPARPAFPAPPVPAVGPVPPVPVAHVPPAPPAFVTAPPAPAAPLASGLAVPAPGPLGGPPTTVLPVAEVGVPAPLPAPAFAPAPQVPPAPDPALRALPGGATARVRSPWAVFGLVVVTLGLYAIYWWFQANRELRDLGRGRQVDLGDSPGRSVAAFALGGLLVVPWVWTAVGTARRIARAQAEVGSPARLDGWVTGLLWCFTGGLGAIPYLQSQLNGVWGTLPVAPGGARGNGRTVALVAAIVVLGLGVVGATAAAIALRAGGGVPAAEGTAGDGATGVDEGADGASVDPLEPEADLAPPPEPVDTNGVLPDLDDEAMETDIAIMLEEHHEALVAGDFETAWDLLTTRKQDQNERRYGYEGWRSGQEAFARYLEPTGVDVAILDTDPETGVATVEVTGMGWTSPTSACSEWSGTTWVRYEGGEWRYDPGYSTTPQREREWKPRYGELLGAGC
jgi:hypothetical protein